MIDSVYNKYESYYPKVFLEKYNFIIIKKMKSNYYVDFYDSGDSDEEYSNEKIQIKLFLKRTI